MLSPKSLATFFFSVIGCAILYFACPVLLIPIAWVYASFNYRTWEINYEIMQMKYSKSPTKGTVYHSFKEMMDDLKNISALDSIRIKIGRAYKNFLDFPQDTYGYVHFLHQRINRGWAVSDTWGFDGYLAKVIYEGLEHLKKHKHGCPMACYKDSDPVDETWNPTDKADKLASARWDKILDSIILTFKIAEKINNDHWHYQPSHKYNKKLARQAQKITDKIIEEYPHDPTFGYVMSKEECKVYEKGWRNFQKYFFNLWD